MNSLRYGVVNNFLGRRLFQEKVAASGVRYLYNDQFLGIDKYVEGRQRTITRLGNLKGNFINRMSLQMNSKVPSMVFTEDLKTIIHSCEDDPEEINVCIQMMKRFHKQNKELRFGTFVFGPVAMRLFYHLKKQDLMLQLINDPELEGFFDQLKSYLLSMDMSFKNGMYSEILESYEQLRNKQIAETKFPREAMVLAAGACYKLNTPEKYQYATDLITGAREARAPIIRKCLQFVVALALNQGRFDVALEILSSIDRFNNIGGNNLKLLAFAGLERIQDAFDILRRVTDQDSPTQTKVRGAICQETLDTIQKSVDRIDDKESSHIFEQLCRSLKESNSVTSQSVEDIVCSPIEPRPFLREGENFGYRERSRFPEQGFRMRERGMTDREDNYPVRRRQFAGIGEDF